MLAGLHLFWLQGKRKRNLLTLSVVPGYNSVEPKFVGNKAKGQTLNTQLKFTCLKSIIEALEKCVKYIQS